MTYPSVCVKPRETTVHELDGRELRRVFTASVGTLLESIASRIERP